MLWRTIRRCGCVKENKFAHRFVENDLKRAIISFRVFLRKVLPTLCQVIWCNCPPSPASKRRRISFSIRPDTSLFFRLIFFRESKKALSGQGQLFMSCEYDVITTLLVLMRSNSWLSEDLNLRTCLTAGPPCSRNCSSHWSSWLPLAKGMN